MCFQNPRHQIGCHSGTQPRSRIGLINQFKSRKVQHLRDTGFGCNTNKHKIMFVNLKQSFPTFRVGTFKTLFCDFIYRSLGCFIVEMRNTVPPWFELNIKEAIKSIAWKETKANLPSGTSTACAEFIKDCFQR